MKKLLSKTRAAADRYGMFGEGGQKIAVGVSGGKDSLVLLRLMAALRDFHPARFSLTALCLDPCFGGENADYTGIGQMCRELDIPLVIRRSRLGEIIFDERSESNPCSLCARMRRGILHNMALEAGCTRLALGHQIRSAAARLKLPVIKSRCPADGCTARADAKKTICLLEKTYPALTERIITALQEGNVSGWGFPGEA